MMFMFYYWKTFLHGLGLYCILYILINPFCTAQTIKPNVTTGLLQESKSTNSTSIGTIALDVLHLTYRSPRNPLYSVYPNCPETCSETWIGDGWCDTLCFNEECAFDGDDCKDWCAPDCPSSWIKDGHCDVNCFRPECHYDGGDCTQNYTYGDIRFPLPSHERFDYSKCPSTCLKEKLNNDVCDEECNIHECNFDGTDCFYQCSADCLNQWLGDGDCDTGCNNAMCGFDKGDCKICSPGCEPGMVGNGICDAQCYNDECYNDMGDCYGLCWYAEKIDYFTQPFFYPHCRNEWKGDGSCDCLCMTPECSYDFDDCADYDCSREWNRLENFFKTQNLSLEKLPHYPERNFLPSSVTV